MGVPTGYAFYNIGFEIFCIILTMILLYKQHTVFNENNTQRAFTFVLYLQVLLSELWPQQLKRASAYPRWRSLKL